MSRKKNKLMRIEWNEFETSCQQYFKFSHQTAKKMKMMKRKNEKFN